jgi:hypothetical protein
MKTYFQSFKRIAAILLVSFFLCCAASVYASPIDSNPGVGTPVVQQSTESDTLAASLSAPDSPSAAITGQQSVAAIATADMQPVHLALPDSAVAKVLAQHALLLGKLGDFHKIMGMYTTVTGVVALFGGVLLLDRKDGMPFAVSFLTIGGIAVGVGMWEIKIGAQLLSTQK